jgi:hypothetical protein
LVAEALRAYLADAHDPDRQSTEET